MTNDSIYEETYENNLFFYTLLKTLVKCKLNENKMILLQATIAKSRILFSNNCEDFKTFLLESESIIGYGSSSRDDYINLVGYLNRDRYDEWCDMIDAGIELLLFKDLIIQEAKAYTNAKQQETERRINDHLCIEYDASTLSMPYGQRVLSSLLVYTLTSIDREKEFILEASGAKVKEISVKIRKLTEKYSINSNSMLILIVDESINQSIRSTAGSSYESRVEYMVHPLVEDWQGHSHDENVNAMEYDFTFSLNGKRAGISAKRTLRERYKQNHEDVSQLTVDYVFVFTLGTDLNAEKVDSLLQKNGSYIVVADEIYAAKKYLSNNPRVISSRNLSTETLMNIMK
ncbi:MAG: hypothetical protein PUC03_02620 [Clostridiales bacterium]|nr:hypothetical protein [Clostridium sp.]MDD6017777.1 hypothetical protein [Clostridiales bacterium]